MVLNSSKMAGFLSWAGAEIHISTKIQIFPRFRRRYQRKFPYINENFCLSINENKVDIDKTQLSTKSITPTTSSSQKN